MNKALERLTKRTETGVAYLKDPITIQKSTLEDRGKIHRLVDRLAAYEDAKDKGQIVPLPCKLGDLLYALWAVPTSAKYVIYCAEVKEIFIAKRNCRQTITFRLEPIDFRGRRKEYREDDFGKLVFTTRGAAEMALAIMKEGVTDG